MGTETDGSIVCPSSLSGLVGIKPTVGLVSRSGIIPISLSQDTAGPMTRTVADAAVLLAAMTGVDTRDAATEGVSPRAADVKGLNAGALGGARISVARKAATLPPTGWWTRPAAEMKARGGIVDPAAHPPLRSTIASSRFC